MLEQGPVLILEELDQIAGLSRVGPLTGPAETEHKT
jgi:hypothetical protein